jgi:hypothetical protein
MDLLAVRVTAGAMRFGVIAFLLAVLAAVIAPATICGCRALTAGVCAFHSFLPDHIDATGMPAGKAGVRITVSAESLAARATECG